MRDAADHLAYLKALIVAHPRIAHWTVLREEAQGDQGLLRYRLGLLDGDLLGLFERFRVTEEAVRITSYSLHWQDAAGRLRRRWDNAAHHPEVATPPSCTR